MRGLCRVPGAAGAYYRAHPPHASRSPDALVLRAPGDGRRRGTYGASGRQRAPAGRGAAAAFFPKTLARLLLLIEYTLGRLVQNAKKKKKKYL